MGGGRGGGGEGWEEMRETGDGQAGHLVGGVSERRRAGVLGAPPRPRPPSPPWPLLASSVSNADVSPYMRWNLR